MSAQLQTSDQLARSEEENPGRIYRRINKSTKLADVCYDIRGPIMAESKRLEAAGHDIIKLNIGNPSPFGYMATPTLSRAIIQNLDDSQGYCDAQGILSAREAIQAEVSQSGIEGVEVDDIYVGNGVSELITMSMQGLLNAGDEVLVPSPDYPLWSAAIRLAGGVPVHYRCDEESAWHPDLVDVRHKTTRRTVAMVVINPNNPTGAVYDRQCLLDLVDWSREHQLVVLADEIYSKITYDDATFTPIASLADDVLFLTFDGLSKAYRAAGFRTGWMVISGPKFLAQDYIEGLNVLAAMRLCSNVPSQHAIEVALAGHQSVYDLTKPSGHWHKQREIAFQGLQDIEGISCVKPQGALYLFPKVDVKKFNIRDDEQFVFELLHERHILIAQGTAFNYPEPDHFRVVFLPQETELRFAIGQIGHFLDSYHQELK